MAKDFKRMVKLAVFALALFPFLTEFSSCDSGGGISDGNSASSLSVTLPTSSRSTYTQGESVSFKITIESRRYTESKSGTPGQVVTFESIPTGEYTVTMLGYTSGGAVSAKGTANATVVANETTNVALVIRPLNYFTVSFYSDPAASSPSSTQNVTEGYTATKPSNPTPPSGKIFKGWSTSSSAYAAFNFGSAITADTVLYAFYTSTLNTPSITVSESSGSYASIFGEANTFYVKQESLSSLKFDVATGTNPAGTAYSMTINGVPLTWTGEVSKTLSEIGIAESDITSSGKTITVSCTASADGYLDATATATFTIKSIYHELSEAAVGDILMTIGSAISAEYYRLAFSSGGEGVVFASNKVIYKNYSARAVNVSSSFDISGAIAGLPSDYHWSTFEELRNLYTNVDTVNTSLGYLGTTTIGTAVEFFSCDEYEPGVFKYFNMGNGLDSHVDGTSVEKYVCAVKTF